MAKKDFDLYFSRIGAQYHEMVEDVKEMEQLCLSSVVSPDQLEQMKKTLAPIKDSYMTLSYINYLLNLPADKKVKARNSRQFEKQLAKIPDKNKAQAVIERNNNQLAQLKEITQ